MTSPALPQARRRRRLLGVVLVLLLVEILCLLDIRATRTWSSQDSHWLTQTVATLASGRPVPPDNDGPIDYRMYWSVARMAQQGHASQTYDYQRLNAFEEKSKSKSNPWIYPPTSIPITFLATISSFGASFIIWTFFINTISMFFLRWAEVPWVVVGSLLISPAALWSDTLGQFGLIAGALFVASLLLAVRQPIRSGLLAGLLTMKPQIGLLLPVVFLARRKASAIIAAIFVFFLLVAVSVLLFGISVWAAFLTQGLRTGTALLVAADNSGYRYGISVFWMARSLGLGVTGSYVLQAFAAIGAIVWCWCAWRDNRAAAPLPLVALTTCLACFVTPYGYTLDLCAFTTGIGLLAWDRGYVRPYDVVLWVFPILGFNLSALFHFLVFPPVVLLAALYANRQMYETAGRRSGPSAIEAAGAGQVT